jgi:hypothetical protein
VRLPDWAYVRLERAYFHQRGIRRREANRRMADDDRRVREWADRMSIAHDMGTCGGAAAGCPFVPCVPFTGWGG